MYFVLLHLQKKVPLLQIKSQVKSNVFLFWCFVEHPQYPVRIVGLIKNDNKENAAHILHLMDITVS